MCNKAKRNCAKQLKDKVIEIKKSPTPKKIGEYNTTILSLQSYYRIATNISKDMAEIAYPLSITQYNRLKKVGSKIKPQEIKYKTTAYEKFYKDYNIQVWNIGRMVLFPLDSVKHCSPMNFSQSICNYTEEGRKLIHDRLKTVDYEVLHYIMKNPVNNRSSEFNDNRISKYIAQNGCCAITGEKLRIGNFETHHKKPIQYGGNDKYLNLFLVLTKIHDLIHATNFETIIRLLKELKVYDNKVIKKINTFRIAAKNKPIEEI